MARRAALLLAVICALGALLSGSGIASGAAAAEAKTRVGAFERDSGNRAGGRTSDSPAKHRGPTANSGQIASAYLVAARETPRLLGPGTTIGPKVKDQLANRGWTERLVHSTLANPTRTVPTRDYRYLPGGTRMDDPATAYYSSRGGYVVRNDRTGDIVQVSHRLDPSWKAPWDR